MELARDGRVGQAACGQAGVFARRQALVAGWSESEIDHRIRTGEWRRLQRRAYSHASLPLTEKVRLAAAVVAARQDCDLAAGAHLSVIALHGLAQRWPMRPHVLVPHSHSPGLDGVVLHRSRDLGPDDVTSWDDIPVTRLERALVDVAPNVPADLLALWLDEAIRTDRATATSVASCALRLRRRGRRGPAAVLELLAQRPVGADGMDSCLEVLFARRLGSGEEAGWVHHHRLVVPATSRRWEIDFAFPDARVSVEVDGTQHDGFRQRARDAQRDADLAALGWRQLRFRWSDVVGDPDRMVREVRAAVSSHLAVPSMPSPTR